MYYFIVLNLKALLFLYMTQAIHKTWVLFVVTLLISLTYLLVVYRYFKRHKHQITFIFYALFSLLMFADVLYSLYFNRLISFGVSSQITQLPGVLNVVSGLLSGWVLLFIIDIPFLLFYFRKKKSFELKPLMVNHFKMNIFINVVVISFLFANHLQTIKAYEFFTYHTFDLVESLTPEIETEDEMITFEQQQNLISKQKNISGLLSGIANQRNVIMIQVEALQNLVVNREYHGIEITPNLNQLINSTDSLYFNQIYQSIARGSTSDAEFATLNSLYPSSSIIYYEEIDDKSFYSLAHLLQDHGYDTAYFHSNEGSFYNRDKMSKALGFNHFYDADDFEVSAPSDIISYGINDFKFFEQSLDYIVELDNESPDPWMSFLITTSSHTPFDLEAEDKTLTLIDDDSNILLNYYEAMHYTDQALGTFINGLKEKGLYQDSIIVVYGDHFGLSATSEDHKMAVEEELNIEYTVEDMMNVPLIVHIPETNIHSTISKTGSQMDIYPTLINLLGIENEQGIMFGADLINSKTYNPALLQFYVPDNSFIDGNLLYLASRDRELDHSVLIDRETNEEIDASLIEHQLELNAQKLQLSSQLIEENKIRLKSLGD